MESTRVCLPLYLLHETCTLYYTRGFNMFNKYELTDVTIQHDGRTLHQIKALRDVGSILKGETGGYVEGYHNLSQEGLCWVGGNAKVYGQASVEENAYIDGNAVCSDWATVRGAAVVADTSEVLDAATVAGCVILTGHCRIYGDAYLCHGTAMQDVHIENNESFIHIHNAHPGLGDVTGYKAPHGDVYLSHEGRKYTFEEMDEKVQGMGLDSIDFIRYYALKYYILSVL